MSGWAEVIGDPIAHSRSPIIHNFWLDALGIDASYRASRVTRADLADHVAALRADTAWRGTNVTMPLKLYALLIADAPSDRAVAAGAANMLMRRDGKIVAGNSDVGAIAKLVHKLGQDGRDLGATTVLGTGGAARAALAALRELGLTQTRIMARDERAAVRLSDEFGLEASPVPLDTPAVGHGFINATPIGMTDGPSLAIDLSEMRANGWLLDMVTSPAETPLMAAARGRGLAVATGLEMLVEQADASFRLFFEADPPRDKDGQLFERLTR